MSGKWTTDLTHFPVAEKRMVGSMLSPGERSSANVQETTQPLTDRQVPRKILFEPSILQTWNAEDPRRGWDSSVELNALYLNGSSLGRPPPTPYGALTEPGLGA